MMSDSLEAEDITQEVFIKAFKKFGSFRSESSVYSWLYRIGINTCLEKIRSKKRKRRWSGHIVSLDKKVKGKNGSKIDRQIPESQDRTDPLAKAISKETHDEIMNAIESLPKKYRQVFILREIEELSYQEISDMLNISINNIGVRLIRARDIIKEKLSM